MNKRITSIVLCLALLVSLMVAAVPVSATDTVKFTMTADKTEANVGDTITYTISIGAVENLAGFTFELVIPEGLTFVAKSSSVNEAWEGELDFGEASFAEKTMIFVGASNNSTNVPGETEVMSFQCTVDEGAAGTLTTDFIMNVGDVFDGDYNDFAFTATGASVTIGGSEPIVPPVGSSVEFSVTTESTTVKAGDTVDFNVYISAIDNLAGFGFTVVIPEGLTYVKGSAAVNGAWEDELDFGEASFAEKTMFFVGASNSTTNVTAETLVMSFQCTVNEGAEGSLTVTLDVAADDVFDEDYNNIPVTVTGATVEISTECAHVWTDATCTAPKTCSICGATEGKANGHNYEAVVTAPDCVNGGYTTYTCSVCGDSYVADEVAALGHTWNAADCTTAPKTCSVCGATEGAAAGHSYEAVVTAPTCTAGGYTTYTCSVCGDSYVGDETAALGHTWTDATCTEPKTCSVCGATEGAAAGHNYEAVVTAPTCTAGGYTTYICSVCGDSYVGDETAALGHTWTDATCTAPKTCSVCGATEGAAAGHSYEAVVTAPTCTAGGYTTYTCSVCGDSYVGDETAALGHTWTEATCTEPKTCSVCGYTEGTASHDWAEATCTAPKTCKVCGATEGAALGHNWELPDCVTPETCSRCGATEGEPNGHSWKAATCTAPKTCADCGATEGEPNGHTWTEATCYDPKTCDVCLETEGEALGHNWTAASCDAAKTCDRCGKTDGEALGHTWVDATCTTPKTCSVCGATEGTASHSYEAVVTAPTCTEAGYTTYTCSVCGDSYVADEVAALGHDWADATCTAPKTCKVCGATEGEVLAHNWKDADCQNPKTCTACGATEGEKGDHVDANKDGKCDVCGYEKNTETGDESVMVFAIVLMIALACGTAVVLGKKKFIA